MPFKFSHNKSLKKAVYNYIKYFHIKSAHYWSQTFSHFHICTWTHTSGYDLFTIVKSVAETITFLGLVTREAKKFLKYIPRVGNLFGHGKTKSLPNLQKSTNVCLNHSALKIFTVHPAILALILPLLLLWMLPKKGNCPSFLFFVIKKRYA